MWLTWVSCEECGRFSLIRFEQLHETSGGVAVVGVVRHLLRFDLSLSQSSTIVFGHILSVEKKGWCISGLYQFYLDPCKISVLFSTPQGQVETTEKSHCVQQNLGGVIAKKSFLPQYVPLLNTDRLGSTNFHSQA